MRIPEPIFESLQLSVIQLLLHLFDSKCERWSQLHLPPDFRYVLEDFEETQALHDEHVHNQNSVTRGDTRFAMH